MKFIMLSLAILFLVHSTSAQDRLGKYQKIVGYEVRPGVVVTPRYSVDGRLCEIGIERRGYSPEQIRLGWITNEEIDSIVDELVPPEERGPRSKDFPFKSASFNGRTGRSVREYENVTIQILYSLKDPLNKKSPTATDIVGWVKWKNRSCE
jgi:hypothetical protein